jgi:hypothetical protein
MAKKSSDRAGYASGSDAAYIKPKLIDDADLLPRDDGGGPGFENYTQEFGDGGKVTGPKAHLSTSGGGEDADSDDEQSMSDRSKGDRKKG